MSNKLDSKTLKKLDSEEKTKLHAEINQIINQRFLLNSAAVTLFGIIMAWMIPKISSGSIHSDCSFACAASILLIVLLLTLFIISHMRRISMKVIVAYLVFREESQYEKEWQEYQKQHSYIGNSKSQALFFIILGTLTIICPFLFLKIFNIPLRPLIGFKLLVIFGFIYVTLITGMGFYGWFCPKDEDMQKKWECVINSLNKDEAV